MKNNKIEISPAQAGMSGEPNVQTHPHSGRGETPENNAISPAPAVSGAVPLFGFVELSDRDRYNIARYTGWEEQDLHGLLISKCKDFLAIPDKKNYLAPRMDARQHWKTLAETENVTIMQRIL